MAEVPAVVTAAPVPPLSDPPALAPAPAVGFSLTISTGSVPPELHAKLAETIPDASRSSEWGRDFSIEGPLEQTSNWNTGSRKSEALARLYGSTLILRLRK
jgi:hypothetical protein